MLTKKEILTECIKAGKDPAYFINNYVKISHPMEGLIPFKTYDFQKQLLHDFKDYRFNVILKARQLLLGCCCFIERRTLLSWQPSLEPLVTWLKRSNKL